MFDHAEVRAGLAHLRLLVNPRDRIAFARALATPPRGLGPAAVGWLSARAAQCHDDDLIAALRDAERVERLRAGQTSAAIRLGTSLTKIAAYARTQSVAATVTETILASGLARTLRRWRGAEAEHKLSRLRALVRAARDFQAESDEPSLAGFLAGAALAGETEGNGDEEEGRVCLATIHAAKGLEFRCVRVVGLEEGTLPHHRALAEGGLEEERRLRYMAMTRAKERLMLSWARERGRTRRSVSRLAGEAGVQRSQGWLPSRI